MPNPLKKHLPVIVILIVAVASRLLIAFIPPSQILYTVDERIVRDSTLLLYMNAVPVSLEWPATTLMIPLYAFGFIDMLINTPLLSSLLHFDLIRISDVFTNYLYQQFNGFGLIKTGRILVALAGLLSYYFVYRFLRNENKSFSLVFFF